ncbi:hypothetical protein DFH11DRAFT_1580210 [Phellopilus nigrolimitatus]|nr:hypothetical protein DFH11DRAFT_1580210 [Phellopilus nigrolimitatus]
MTSYLDLSFEHLTTDEQHQFISALRYLKTVQGYTPVTDDELLNTSYFSSSDVRNWFRGRGFTCDVIQKTFDSLRVGDLIRSGRFFAIARALKNGIISGSDFTLDFRSVDFPHFKTLYDLLWGRRTEQHRFIQDVEGSEVINLIDGKEMNPLRLVSSKVVVREEYKSLLELIKIISLKAFTGKSMFRIRGGVVVSGQQGVGKTTFLFVVLINRLLNAEPTLFRGCKGNYIGLSEHGCFIYPPSPSPNNLAIYPKGVWVLADPGFAVDAFGAIDEPLYNLNFFVVYTTSPNEARFKEWHKQTNATTLFMAPWSWDEIERIAYITEGSDFSYASARTVYDRYSISFRDCQKVGRDPTEVSSMERRLARALSVITIDVIRSLTNGIENSDVSDALSTLIPSNGRTDFTIELVTYYVAQRLFQKLQDVQHVALIKMFNSLNAIPQSATPAGWLWGSFCQQFIISKPTHTVKDVSTPDTVTFTLPVSKHCAVNFRSLGRDLSQAQHSVLEVGVYFPSTRYQASFDGFAITDEQDVILFQFTAMQRSGLVFNKFDELSNVFKKSGCSRLLPWNSKKKWLYVSLVPNQVVNSVKKVSGDKGKGGREWDNYVQQFVCSAEYSTNFSTTQHIVVPNGNTGDPSEEPDWIEV